MPDGRQVQIQSIDPSGYPKAYTQIEGWEYWPWSVVQGVVLSPDWLKRAGCHDPNFSVISFSGGIIAIQNGKFYVHSGLGDSGSYGAEVKIEYVHELQRLFHSLSGTHLTFDEK